MTVQLLIYVTAVEGGADVRNLFVDLRSSRFSLRRTMYTSGESLQ